MKLSGWRQQNPVSTAMNRYTFALDQMNFVDGHISHILTATEENGYVRAEPLVVSTHKSKSITLPVYQFQSPGIGIFTMRGNFHNWNVALNVTSGKPVKIKPDYFPKSHGEYLFWEGMDGYNNTHPPFPLFQCSGGEIRFGFCCWSDYDLYSILKTLVIENR